MQSFRVVLLCAITACSTELGKPSQFIVPGAAGAGASGPDGAAGDPAQAGRDGGGQSGAGGASGSGAGLPCEVEAVLRARCQSCHSAPPASGVPMALISYADLAAPARSDASRRVADVALARMQLGQMPPPPAAPATAVEVAGIEDWIARGAMRETCESSVGDAGLPLDGATAPDPYDTTTVCTSGEYWDDGDDDSPRMHPGGPCVSCHAQEDGPDFTIGGTVYPTAHEPTDCNGVDGEDDVEVSVVITDAEGQVLTLEVNDVGNFYTERAIAFPFRAKVVAGGRERHMGAAQMTGNCNGCHTESGANGAPGRIMAP